MSARDFKPYELMQKVVDFLERELVPYRIVGSMASIIYGEPRFTNDVDILAALSEDKIEALCDEFPSPDFYVSRSAVREAIENCHQFNILHPSSSFRFEGGYDYAGRL